MSTIFRTSVLSYLTLVSCGPGSKTTDGESQGGETSVPTSTSSVEPVDSTGVDASADRSETETGMDEPITEEFCSGFATQAACESATPSDAPFQCAYFDLQAHGGSLVDDPDEGLRCLYIVVDYDGRKCHMVQHVPSACEAGPPRGAQDLCEMNERPPLPRLFYKADSESSVVGFGLPCDLRPPDYIDCWEHPAPQCFCSCYPAPCSVAPWNCEDQSDTDDDDGSTTSN